MRHRSRDLGADFTTPLIDLDAIVTPRSQLPPLLDVKLAEIIEPWLKGGKPNQKKFFATLNRSLTRQEALVIALNTGNEGNLQRLLGGEGWTADQLKPVLESLSAQDWKVAQNIWDHFESYRPLIAEKEKRVFGKEPEWVEPSPFEVTTADGKTVQVKGGYYPIKYDPAASVRAEEHADAEGAVDLRRLGRHQRDRQPGKPRPGQFEHGRVLIQPDQPTGVAEFLRSES